MARPPSSLAPGRRRAAHRLGQAADHRQADPGPGARAARPLPAPGRTSRTGGAGAPPARPAPASSIVRRTNASVGQQPCGQADPRAGRRVLDRVLDGVGDRLVEEDRVDAAPAAPRAPPRAAGRRAAVRAARASARPGRRARRRRARRGARPPRSGSGRAGSVTSRFRYSTSRSIASALSRLVLLGSGRCPAGSVPAAARIVASGVRRSCETDWRSADFSSSLWRAISAARDSAASRSWASACPTWSAAAASSRVSVSSGSPPDGLVSAQIEPKHARRPPRSARGRPRCRALARAARDWVGWWMRTHCAGSSPGMRRRRCWCAREGGRPLACRCQPRPAPGRSRRARSRPDPCASRRAAAARWPGARHRSTRGWRARSSPGRGRAPPARGRRASRVRDRWRAASCPTTIPTKSSRTRLSHSAGSRTVKV